MRLDDVPVLILSGALDPATPPSCGERVKGTLAKARHVVSPGASHGVSLRGCTPNVIAKFLKEPEKLAELDTSCIEGSQRPPFFLTFAGPAP